MTQRDATGVSRRRSPTLAPVASGRHDWPTTPRLPPAQQAQLWEANNDLGTGDGLILTHAIAPRRDLTCFVIVTYAT